MGRHGYTEDLDQQHLAMWRGQVMSAIRGKRGQALIRDLREALDAMPEKRLIADDLVTPLGEVCALGAVGLKRGVEEIKTMDPEEHDGLGRILNVAPCLIMEIEYMNDDGGYSDTPEKRWERMRKWCDQMLATSRAH